jgi:hypothetical protein
LKIYKTNDENILQDCLKSFAFRNEYDIRANDVSRKILDRIKNDNIGEFTEGNILVEIIRQKITNSTFENFYVGAITKNDSIYVNVILDDGFSSKDYQRFVFTIYEVLRHELEHLDKYIMGKKPDEKYVQLYHDLRSSHSNEERVEMVAQYILSDTEIDSYVKSIMYVAKKQNKSAIEVIEQVIKRAFFGNDSQLMQEAMKNPGSVSIIDNVRKILKSKLVEYYPTFKEKWL